MLRGRHTEDRQGGMRRQDPRDSKDEGNAEHNQKRFGLPVGKPDFPKENLYEQS